MDLYVMRHGIAEDVSATGADRDRELTAEGRKKTREAGQALKGLEIQFELVLASPFARAWQTAEILVEALNCPRLLSRCEALSSGAPLKPLVAELGAIACGSVLIVGHEPDLSQLISVMLSGGLDVAVSMKKGALAKIRFPSHIEAGYGRLEWLLAPKHLCRLG
jgi:phosphohistidine phosphatase